MNGKVKSCYSLGSQQAKRVSILGDNFIDNYRLPSDQRLIGASPVVPWFLWW